MSKRTYIVTGIEVNQPVTFKTTAIELITGKGKNEGTEVLYSLQMDVDRILDLKQRQSMYISLNRDNSESLGVIHRVE